MNKWDQIAQRLGFQYEGEMFAQLYVTDKLSISQIAGRLGVGTCTVTNRLNKCGIERRPKGGANSKLPQSYKLFHLDQRIVLTTPPRVLANLTRISYSLTYKYQHRRLPHGVLYNHPDSGVNPLRPSEQDALTAPPGPRPTLPELLSPLQGSE